MVPRCSSTVQTAKGVAILFLRPLQLRKLRHLSDNVKIFSDNGPFLYRSLKDIRYLISEILAVCPYLIKHPCICCYYMKKGTFHLRTNIVWLTKIQQTLA